MAAGTRHLRVHLIALGENAGRDREGKPAKGVVVKFSHWVEAEGQDELDKIRLDFAMEWGKLMDLLSEEERKALKGIREKLVGEIRRDIPKLAHAQDDGGI
jgi:hypothetical protein